MTGDKPTGRQGRPGVSMLRGAGALLALSWLLLAATEVPGQEIAKSLPAFTQADALLDQGDTRQARQLLQGLPVDGEACGDRLWRMARVEYELGRMAASGQNALAHYRMAEEYARGAIVSNPDSGDGYKWLAIALGAQAGECDTETRIRLSRDVKAAIEKAIALAPGDDISYLLLGRWHYKVSALDVFSRTLAAIIYGGLPEASLDEAEKLLLKAISLRDRIAHRYYLAKVYERMGRHDDARGHLQKALLLEVTFPEEAEELNKCRDKLRN